MKILIAILIVSLLAAGCSLKPRENKNQPLTDKEIAIQKAKELFEEKQKEGIALIEGPCLTNEIIPDWVVDIAHKPHQAVDDLPENQCSAFVNGIARHFVELDVSGKLIRAQ